MVSSAVNPASPEASKFSSLRKTSPSSIGLESTGQNHCDEVLVGIFVTPSEWPHASYLRGHDAIAQMIEEQRAKEARTVASASGRFESVAEQEGISFEFRTIRPSDIADDALFHSLHADIVTVGHPKPGGLPEYQSAESMLLATGVPVRIVPDRWNAGTIAENILVAWNATREARRAITDAMPLLQKARTVSVIVVNRLVT